MEHTEGKTVAVGCFPSTLREQGLQQHQQINQDSQGTRVQGKPWDRQALLWAADCSTADTKKAIGRVTLSKDQHREWYLGTY